MNSSLVCLNGRFLPLKKAQVSIMDHGFLYGDGIYETIRVYGGHPFMLNDHLKRLHQSAKGIGLRIPYSNKAIQKFSQRALGLNKQGESILRIMVTRGPGLRLSRYTIESHLRNIYGKLSVDSRSKAINIAYSLGLF